MPRHLRLRELFVGIEGMALLRHLYENDGDAADRRLAEVRRLLEDDAFAEDELIQEADPRGGYAAWAGTYDEPGNPIIALEEPAVWSIVDSLPPGRALDAACGTGRHARHLIDIHHHVTGIDFSPEMLALAEGNVPEATFIEADLHRFALPDASFQLVVCGLALAHVGDLQRAVCELARVLAPGGRLVVSVLHPFLAHIGWHAPFANARGERGFVREHAHTHGDYLTAFWSTDLRPLACLEPALTEDQVRSKRRAFAHIPEATKQAYVGQPGVLVWDVEKPRPKD
jgi:SAM-dependent methyltransferase